MSTQNLIPKLFNYMTRPVADLLKDPRFLTAVNGRVTAGVTTQAALTHGGIALKSGNALAVTFTIAHGFSAPPSFYFAQAGNAAAAGISFTTADATNITVTYDVAPASGTNNLRIIWQAKL